MSATPPTIDLKDTAMQTTVKANQISLLRQLAWLVRREIWEHRVLLIVPALLGLLLVVLRFLPRRMAVGFSAASEGAKAADRVMMPYIGTCSLMFLVGLLLAVYFSVSSPGEHRDRTMLFWKSLPISDGMSIAAKVLIAMLVVPLILYAAAAVTQLMILLISTTVMAVKGDSLSAYFQRLELWELTKDFAYWLLASSLWYAPLFAFLMAISTFAKRAVAVWAVAPFLIGYAMDWFSDSNRFIEFVTHRAFGSLMTAFTPQADGAKDGLGLVPDPAKFFSTPDVWWGLLVAALLIAAAVRIRKRRASE